jgi:hypothetical protein
MRGAHRAHALSETGSTVPFVVLAHEMCHVDVLTG